MANKQEIIKEHKRLVSHWRDGVKIDFARLLHLSNLMEDMGIKYEN